MQNLAAFRYHSTRFDIDPTTGCWLWNGPRFTSGYGRWPGGFQAHVVLFKDRRGEIPPGFTLHHTCHTRRCVNPDHLQLIEKGAHCKLHSALITHCIHGHEFTPENTYYSKSTKGYTQRSCAICHRLRDNIRSMRRKGLIP